MLWVVNVACYVRKTFVTLNFRKFWIYRNGILLHAEGGSKSISTHG